ncbi:DUF3526 domain-containing protein [Acanthopleuribacter pedis]|uniref:DUF3526 domain-containing protein n=1 Tax=Acanthopleuribacter pedis TaxID=442870 RepID=A0A8J7Q6Q3_9BACT|nr:DUF3526 domain-containing protein [Acanthopleuribacter pedis]MBO1319725.1 DUF3526 domain-containing protein [Acanthopleuribacter pedis]
MMWRVIWAHESRLLRRDRISLAAALGFVMIMIAAAWVNGDKLNRWEQAGATAVAEQEARFSAQHADLVAMEAGEKHYDSLFGSPQSYFSWAGAVTVFPFDSWAMLSTGSGDLFAPVSQVKFYTKARVPGHDTANPMPRLFGAFDPAFVLLYLLPLFVIALNYGIVGDERECGILPMVLAQPVSPRQLFLLKIVWRWGVTSLVVLFALCAAFAVGGVNPLAKPLALAQLAGLVWLYCGFWFLLCLLVNTGRRGAHQCAVALTGLWAMLLLVVPAGAHLIGGLLYPIPSRIEAIAAQRLAAADAAKQGGEILAKFYQDHPELSANRGDTYAQYKATFQWYQRTLAVFEAVEAITAPMEQDFEARVEARLRFEQGLALLSPAVSVREALDELAGVSRVHYRAYQQEVQDYAARFRMFFAEKAFGESVIESADVARLPRFDMAPLQSNASVLRALAWLALVNLLLLAACAVLGREIPAR